MTKLIALVLGLVAASPEDRVTVSTVPCRTVADCWLSADGKPIRRPKTQRGRAFPDGDCGKHLVWLQNRLTCENHVCVAELIGDRC